MNVAAASFCSVTPWELDRVLLTVGLDRVFGIAYHEDLHVASNVSSSYFRGPRPTVNPLEAWKALPGVTLLTYQGATELPEQVPFVYQAPDKPYLVNLAREFSLHEMVAGIGDEYQAMLKVCGWLGTRFDHGADPVPGGTTPIDPSLVLQGGEKGGRYWCEIAAKVTVEVASALGWPARLVTASRDGRTWEHAVAELWSNRFNKWFVVDTDFNVMYTSREVPLSAFELCHLGPELQRQGRLTVLRLAPAKPSLKDRDLIPFYRYVHIDLRNDWFTRRLRRLSPAGGDFNTWWTARPGVGPLWTAKRRVDDAARFDWKVNGVQLFPLGREPGGGIVVGAHSYAPGFDHFEVYDNGKKYPSRDGRIVLAGEGVHTVSARVVDAQGNRGPLYTVSCRIERSGSL